MSARRCAALLGLLLLALPAAARAPDQSPRPMARGDAAADRVGTAFRPRLRPDAMTQATDRAVAAALLHPKSRPPSAQTTAAAARPPGLPFLAPTASPSPVTRPEGLAERVFFKRRKSRKGSVCGDIDIQGEAVGRVRGKLRGCGTRDAVRVREVAGVRLSQQAVMTCDTARALKTWVERGIKPAFRFRGPVVELRVAAHYACRTRNNRPGAKISEHGRAQAIDISGFVMMDGEVITVREGWGRGTTLRPLRQVWKSACGPFGTVLGPESDGYHRDHFHVDIARYRGGPYCR